MNKPIMTFFALLLSIATVAQEEPSKEDTIAWLYEKIRRIEIPEFDNPGTRFEYNTKEETIEIDFPEDGTTIEISYLGTNDYKFLNSEHPVYSRRDYTISAKLSDLSAHVELDELEETLPDYVDIVLSCSLRDCFNGEAEWFATGSGKGTNTVSWSAASVTIPRTIADRVQKALSHLITLSGGKEKVSEDLF